MSNAKPVQIGTMYKSTDRESGELSLDSKGRQRYNFTLSKDVKITINGKPFSGKYFYVNRPDEKLEIMLKNGTITEEQYDEKVARFESGGDLENLVFELVAPNK